MFFIKPVVNNGDFNYQPQLVFLPDFRDPSTVWLKNPSSLSTPNRYFTLHRQSCTAVGTKRCLAATKIKPTNVRNQTNKKKQAENSNSCDSSWVKTPSHLEKLLPAIPPSFQNPLIRMGMGPGSS